MRLRSVKGEIDKAAAGADPDVIFTRSAVLLREGAAISRATLDGIEALEQPSAAGDAIDAWVTANRRQEALTVTLAGAFDAQDETRIARLSELIDKLEDANNATAMRLGTRTCAERVAR